MTYRDRALQPLSQLEDGDMVIAEIPLNSLRNPGKTRKIRLEIIDASGHYVDGYQVNMQGRYSGNGAHGSKRFVTVQKPQIVSRFLPTDYA